VEVDAKGNALVIDGHRIALSAERDPTKIPWAAAGAHYVLECSGVFADGAAAAGHLTAGARKVIISAPAKDENTPTLLMGVNHDSYDAKARQRFRRGCGERLGQRRGVSLRAKRTPRPRPCPLRAERS
jgi:glyceraldehyde-3-phosphate dehydrogenase/erythrose-4-phosphate dehydrogenase